ncbi:hypothetical protein J3R82DRAFT_8212 [Butyriboletus roseoflavus]|nr:hypothetical protein J3R82DRAFT_8212 [Butyriboletus roseoflavus]
MSFCNPTFTITSQLGNYKLIPRLILAVLLLILAVARLCTESYQSYKATRQWQVNRYLNILVRDGVLYFIAYVASSLLYALTYTVVPAETQTMN